VAAAFTKTSTWNGGYGGQYTITNRCPAAVTAWTVEFDLPAGTTVSSSWSSVRTVSGQHYTFRNAPYNGDIAPGASESFGFNAKGSAPPAGCRVNGSPC
jgi:cellulase/cellobiase CelA1